MAKELFQKKAIEAAATPEKLASSIHLVRPPFVLALALMAVLGLAVLVGSIFVTVPLTVAGKGVILNAAGIAAVSTPTGGQVLDLQVEAGDRVEANQVVVALNQPNLAQQVSLQQAALASLHNERSLILSFNQLKANAQADYALSQGERLRESIAEQHTLLETYEKQLRDREQLFERGTVAKSAVIDAEANVSGTKSAIVAAQAQLGQLEEQAKLDAVDSAERLLDIDSQISEAERQLAQLQGQLNRANVVRAPIAGQIAEIRVSRGDVITADTVVVTILPKHTDGEKGMSGFLFVSAEKGSNIRVGMEAKVYPTTVKRQEFGFVEAKVSGVSMLPVSEEEMMRYFRNEELVSALLEGGVPFQVTLDLPYADTPSGLKWSSSDGPPFRIGHGAEFEADVTTRDVRLISFVLPFTEKFFSPPRVLD